MEITHDKHPSRVFRFCPRCGSETFIFDNEKRFHCQACDFVYYINAATAVAVIVRLPDDRIILTQRRFDPAAGKYDLPGGYVDLNERAEIAAIREVKEEINIDIQLHDLEFLASFPNTYEYKGICYFTCDIAFVARYSGAQLFEANDDVQKVITVKPGEIDFDAISFDSIRNILRKYIEVYA
jgi:8-oxo-dGTP pyrophosphatase MutT (NUDIX family)